MRNNSLNPQFITDSEQRRPIAKLQFSEGDSKPKSQNQASSSNNSSQKNEQQ
jgi:hypothetical protein